MQVWGLSEPVKCYDANGSQRVERQTMAAAYVEELCVWAAFQAGSQLLC